MNDVARRVRAFARRSFDGSTSIMQTMSETVLGMRIVKAFNLEEPMRQRMATAIKEVERSANRIAAGGALRGVQCQPGRPSGRAPHVHAG